ncbi:MAG: hypothetical protein HQ523_02925 [Lentisphaerae bacterium]|nr:hypothetical protein [Lentisphaerota bacterium]
MPRRGKQPTSLLAQAFALKESNGWAEVQDGMQIQRMIGQQRRRALLIALLAVLIIAAAGAILIALL